MGSPSPRTPPTPHLSPPPHQPPPSQPSATPTTPPQTTPPPAFLQFNANGIMSGYTELSTLLSNRSIKVACIQETKLSPASTFKDFPGFTSVRRDRPGARGGGGLLTLIHHSIKFTELPTTYYLLPTT